MSLNPLKNENTLKNWIFFLNFFFFTFLHYHYNQVVCTAMGALQTNSYFSILLIVPTYKYLNKCWIINIAQRDYQHLPVTQHIWWAFTASCRPDGFNLCHHVGSQMGLYVCVPSVVLAKNIFHTPFLHNCQILHWADKKKKQLLQINNSQIHFTKYKGIATDGIKITGGTESLSNKTKQKKKQQVIAAFYWVTPLLEKLNPVPVELKVDNFPPPCGSKWY